MKPTATLALIILAAWLGATSSWAKDETPANDHWSVRGVYLGMTSREAIDVLGSPPSVTEPSPEYLDNPTGPINLGLRWLGKNGQTEVFLVVDKTNNVRRITGTTLEWHNRSIRVGDNQESTIGILGQPEDSSSSRDSHFTHQAFHYTHANEALSVILRDGVVYHIILGVND